MTISAGAKANKNGQELEKEVEVCLQSLGLSYVKQKKFKDIYDKNAKMDFFVNDLDLAIECKYQRVAGTSDQKMPFVVQNIEIFPSSSGLLIVSGKHFRENFGLQKYLDNVSDNTEKFNWIFFEDTHAWLSSRIASTKFKPNVYNLAKFL
jgi:hypothetical protein